MYLLLTDFQSHCFQSYQQLQCTCKRELYCMYFILFIFQESLKKVLQEKLEAIQKLTEIEVSNTNKNRFFKLVFLNSITDRQDC